MTRTPKRPQGRTPTRVGSRDRARFAAIAATAVDPETVMAATEAVFGDMVELIRRGERVAAAGASIVVTNTVLRLCTVQATSAVEADDKLRFLAIIARWSITRNPSLTAILETSQSSEASRWALDEAGAMSAPGARPGWAPR